MYNAGHFFEMAVEEQKVTGNTKVGDSAKRFADHIDGIFGPNKRYDVDGHQEVEMALIFQQASPTLHPFHTDPMLPPGTNSAGKLMILRSALPLRTASTQRTARRMTGLGSQDIWAMDG